jgi:hypothetical protein
MTCYIGSLAGGRDIGRIRVISASATTIIIAENSYSWINGWFLTVAKYHEPWTIFPRIVLDDDNIPTTYRDYDIAYTDQNQYMQPVINMGPHYAGFLDSLVSGTYEQVWYSSSGTFDPTVGGGITSYDWEFEGGMPASSSAANPGWIEYTGSGYYLTRLRAVTDDGKTGTAFRHIMILDRPGGSGTNEPVKAWGFRGFDGDRESGGYTVGIWLREAAGLTAITEGSLIVIFSEDWEGNDPVTKIGANAENRGQILYSGYVLEDTTYWNPITSRLEFETASITGRMGELATYAHVTKSAVNATVWTELRDQTVDRAVISFLRWFSTVLEVHDFAQTGDTKWLKWTDFERGSLYESINNFLMNALLARMVSDRQGKIWAEVDERVVPTGSARQANDHMQEVLDVSNSDWRGEISIPRRFESELAYLEMGGINYSGPSETGGIAAFLAGAPGNEVPDYFGSVERAQGLVVSNQLQLNELVGYAFGMRNSDYPEVTIPIAGDYRFLDIAPQHRILVTVAENDTHRGIVWTQKPFIPQEISYQWLPQFQSLLMELGLAEETGGEPGFGSAATILIPPDPPYSIPDLPDWKLPDFPPTMPPIPEIPPIEFPPSSGNLVYYLLGSTLVRTRNFWDTDPDWEIINTTGTVGGGQAFQLDPFDPVNSAMLMTYKGSGADDDLGPYIYRTSNLNSANPTWTEVWGKADNLAHLPHSQRKCYDLKPSYLRSGEWYMANRERALGGGPGYRPMRTSDSGGSWSRIWGGIPNSNAADASITPSKGDSHGGLIVWMKTGAKDIWRSANRGGFWVARADMDAAGGQIYTMWGLDAANYAVCGDQHSPPVNAFEIWVTTNGANFWSNITPVFDGAEWGLIRHDNGPAQPAHRFFSSPNSANWYAFLRKQNSVQHIFASRPGVGGNWAVHHRFLGNIEMADANLGNELQFYARGTSTDFEIMGSLDGGYNWLDKEGDLAAVLGQAVDNYGSTGIQVVWTV